MMQQIHGSFTKAAAFVEFLVSMSGTRALAASGACTTATAYSATLPPREEDSMQARLQAAPPYGHMPRHE